MSVEAEPEENAFELDDLVIKPDKLSTSSKPTKRSPKAPGRPQGELFARITRRHCALLANVDRISTVIFFNHLMMCSIKEFNRPFELPVEDLTKDTGLDRHQQLDALNDLAKVGIIKLERRGRYELPFITIPGTSKAVRITT